MSTTLEAESEAAAAEAAAALEAEENAAAIEAHEASELAARAEELEAAAAAGRFEDSAGITDEQDAGEAAPLSQAEREASAEHDGTAEKPKRQRKRSAKTDEQGTLEGTWEKLIGGTPDTELKLNLSKPASVILENAPATLLKQSVHRLVITVKVTGFGSDDTLDPETHDVASSKGSRKLRVIEGSFLDPEEYITRDDDAEADAEATA